VKMAPQHITMRLGLVWIKCLDQTSSLGLREALKDEAQVHCGPLPPEEGGLSSVILCPKEEETAQEEGIASEVRYLRTLAPSVPILVFVSSADPQLARAALRAGASGIAHAGIRPAQLAQALSLVSEGEIVIPRRLVRELVGQRLFLKLPSLLSP
jgi:hypothetical protein